MEGNIYRTNGLDCFTNGSLDLLAAEYIFPRSLPFFFALLALLPSGICHFRSFALPSRTGGMQFGQTDFAEWIVLDLYYKGLRVRRRSPASTIYRHELTFVAHALTTCPKAHNAFPFRILYRSSLFRISSASFQDRVYRLSDLFIPSPLPLLISLCKIGKISTIT